LFHLKNVNYKDILNIENLIIPEHRITCIVGESGSGKTTLLRLLNKLISCDYGEILYKNKPLTEIDPIELRRNVVMLPQSPAIFNGTIKDNLLIGLKFAEKPILSNDKLYEVLKFINLDKELNEDADKLSGGEKQRLALGRIILLDPEVFLLDEPSSALDEETEEIIIEKLVEHTKSTNKTLIMVTHSKRVANQFADNVIEVKKGKIINQEEF
jgi:putative ABC transport system ATP-binding protein